MKAYPAIEQIHSVIKGVYALFSRSGVCEPCVTQQTTARPTTQHCTTRAALHCATPPCITLPWDAPQSELRPIAGKKTRGLMRLAEKWDCKVVKLQTIFEIRFVEGETAAIDAFVIDYAAIVTYLTELARPDSDTKPDARARLIMCHCTASHRTACHHAHCGTHGHLCMPAG